MTHGCSPARAGRRAAQMPAAPLPVTGSRVSGSISSSPTARTSGPKSSDSISRRYRFSIVIQLLFGGENIRGKPLLVFVRLFAQVQPVKECIRRFQPNSEPLQNLLLLVAFVRLDARVSGDHFGPPAPQPRYFEHSLSRRALPFRTELAPKLVQAHQTYFRFLEGRKVEEISKLLFVLTIRICIC